MQEFSAARQVYNLFDVAHTRCYSACRILILSLSAAESCAAHQKCYYISDLM